MSLLPPFEYLRPKSVDEALEMLSSREGARVLAGGQSLLPMMKLRVYRPTCLVDINFIPELREISVSGDQVIVGAMVTHSEIIENKIINENVPLLSKTAENIADIQCRNRGTIGGSLCHADPAADYLPTLLALDARVVVRGKGGTKELRVEDFILGPFTTVLGEGEMVVGVKIPSNTDNFKYEKFSRRRGDFAICNVAAILKADQSGTVNYARIAVGALRDRPKRLRELEDALKGKKPTQAELAEMVKKATQSLAMVSDLHGSSDYRKSVLKKMLFRVITELMSVSGGRD